MCVCVFVCVCVCMCVLCYVFVLQAVDVNVVPQGSKADQLLGSWMDDVSPHTMVTLAI